MKKYHALLKVSWSAIFLKIWLQLMHICTLLAKVFFIVSNTIPLSRLGLQTKLPFHLLAKNASAKLVMPIRNLHWLVFEICHRVGIHSGTAPSEVSDHAQRSLREVTLWWEGEFVE